MVFTQELTCWGLTFIPMDCVINIFPTQVNNIVVVIRTMLLLLSRQMPNFEVDLNWLQCTYMSNWLRAYTATEKTLPKSKALMERGSYFFMPWCSCSSGLEGPMYVCLGLPPH